MGGAELVEDGELARSRKSVISGAGSAGEMGMVGSEKFVIASLPFFRGKKGDTYEQRSNKSQVSNSYNPH